MQHVELRPLTGVAGDGPAAVGRRRGPPGAIGRSGDGDRVFYQRLALSRCPLRRVRLPEDHCRLDGDAGLHIQQTCPRFDLKRRMVCLVPRPVKLKVSLLGCSTPTCDPLRFRPPEVGHCDHSMILLLWSACSAISAPHTFPRLPKGHHELASRTTTEDGFARSD
jgi:hypothetical protein